MDTQEILRNLFIDEIKNTFHQYNGLLFLTNKDVAKILRTTPDNIRKRISCGMYKGLYVDKKGKNETVLWNKFKFFQWYFDEQLKLLK